MRNDPTEYRLGQSGFNRNFLLPNHLDLVLDDHHKMHLPGVVCRLAFSSDFYQKMHRIRSRKRIIHQKEFKNVGSWRKLLLNFEREPFWKMKEQREL